MECEPRWGDSLSADALLAEGDGVSTCNRTCADSLSPHPTPPCAARTSTRPLEGRVKTQSTVDKGRAAASSRAKTRLSCGFP